jgi:DNA topoisomerase-3
MTVYIAEKPDIASSMASFLWSDYAACRNKHCYQKGDVIVTWAYGHILMTAMPEAYGKEYADFSKYPIFPTSWKKFPSPSVKEQFEYIKNVLKKADVVVNGGDPDREGQLLIDEILEYVGYQGEVRRILINAKDPDSMKRAFDGIVPNEKFRPLYHAGLARERADWLVGINLSRAYTMSARAGGTRNVWRVGRVKIPTLALVVNREKEILDFHSIEYYELEGKFSKGGIPFSATLKPAEDAPTDSEGRIIKRKYLEEVQHEVKNKPAKVILSERKSQMENAPLPYSLDTLQVEANKRYGMSPSSVLAKVQSLYEKKFVSYPRSDCNYIPTSQHVDGRRILQSLADYGLGAAAEADAGLKGRCFNDGKVSAHHAIIPTGIVPKGLDEWERKVYDMIAVRYIVQFYPPCKFDTVKYEIESQGHVFAGNGKAVVSPGWRSVVKSDDKDDEVKEVPNLIVGDVFSIPIYIIETKKTKPPKRFTEGTLLAAMTNIWRFVSPDNPNREKLKECKGIGTPATRDSIISDLLATSSGKSHSFPCIQKKGKELVPTDFGTAMIESIHESLTKPDLTAIMEYNLSAIADGKMGLDDFMRQTEKMVRDNIRFAEESVPQMASGSMQNDGQEVPPRDCSEQREPSCLHGWPSREEQRPCQCPVCHRETLVRKYSPKTKKHFWVCQEESCVHPATGKPVFYEDYRKKPVINLCPQCGLPLNNVYSKKKKQLYWFCPKCNEFKTIK